MGYVWEMAGINYLKRRPGVSDDFGKAIFEGGERRME